ncbi:MAG TPA: GAF domain-containing SpoIIE family protein phosphatase [Vicinamibacterales bacterium]|nr:GAF domain-containing SpoIIE family protein phosphatase [Vicinamibacterales bacterium]
MSRVTLRHVIGPRQDAGQLVADLAAAMTLSVSVEDADGRLLHGEPVSVETPRHAVTIDGADAGWVSGEPRARVLAALLTHLLSKEAERKALGSEVLHLYREVNLIYSFSEKLAALLDLERVATLTVQEARHLISASDGAIMLLNEQTGELTTLAGFGDSLPHLTGFTRGYGVIGSIVASGIAEIVNDVDSDPRRLRDGTGIRALLCAPLKVGERVIGVIALGSAAPAAYTAAELKLLNTLALQTATAIENARLFERTVQAARDREELLAANKEMELAARIQADLFPAAMPGLDGLDLAARNRPARRCGGDYYDALLTKAPNGTRRVLLCVADVSGKGMPAALLMSHTQATLRALLGRTASLPELARQAGDLLFASTAGNKYVTAAFLDLDLDADPGRARFVSAGHVDCLVVNANGEALRLASTGAPLGLLPPGLPYDETEVMIEPGDCAVLFSDGVADARSAADEEFGDDRLVDIVRTSMDQPAETIVERVFDAIDRFVGDAPQFDDITILVLRRLGGHTPTPGVSMPV